MFAHQGLNHALALSNWQERTPFCSSTIFNNEELKAELERLRNEIDALKKGTSTLIPMKKGAVQSTAGAVSRDLVQRAMGKSAGHVGQYLRIRRRKRSALKTKD